MSRTQTDTRSVDGNTKLLSCPFGCAGDVYVQHKGAGAPLIFVWCPRCEMHGPSRYDEAEAIAAWNARPSAHPGDDEVERVTGVIYGVMW